jgi:hypothetical protein
MLMAAFFFKLAKERPEIAGRAMAALLAIDAIALFSVPLFSGGISTPPLSNGVNYLKKRIGSDRFYTLGPIAPNYGAYYHIASINYSSLPVAENWLKYINEHIDPYAGPYVFDGFAHGPLRSRQTGQNSIAPERSLPQLGQVRWGSVFMDLSTPFSRNLSRKSVSRAIACPVTLAC